jgi:hypothetical protein
MSMVIDGSNGLTYPNSSTQASSSVVLQVVSTNLTGLVSTVSSTLSFTGFTATITPKFATSKILVLVNLGGAGKYAANTALQIALYRNSTNVFASTDIHAYTGSSSSAYANLSFVYLDSPATTTATSYNIYFASASNTGTAYINNYNLTPANNNSTITLMEIAG